LNYWDLIKDAFWITLRNRYLWFFGFFAGVGGTSDFNSNFPMGGGGPDNDFDRGGASAQFFGQLPFDGPVSGVGVAALIGIVLLGLVLFVIFLALVVISNGGLADSVAAIDRGERRSFGSTWQAGASRFWRVLGYCILFFLIGLALLIAIAAPIGLVVAAVFVGTEATGARVATVVFAVLVAIPLGVLPGASSDPAARPEGIAPTPPRGGSLCLPVGHLHRLQDRPVTGAARALAAKELPLPASFGSLHLVLTHLGECVFPLMGAAKPMLACQLVR
jgi:hypothetical protein